MKEYDKETDIWFKHFGKLNTIHSRELKKVRELKQTQEVEKK